MAKKKADRHKAKPFQLRMPDSLKAKLEKLAEQNFRTVTAEIIESIRHHLQRHGMLPPSSAPSD